LVGPQCWIPPFAPKERDRRPEQNGTTARPVDLLWSCGSSDCSGEEAVTCRYPGCGSSSSSCCSLFSRWLAYTRQQDAVGGGPRRIQRGRSHHLATGGTVRSGTPPASPVDPLVDNDAAVSVLGSKGRTHRRMKTLGYGPTRRRRNSGALVRDIGPCRMRRRGHPVMQLGGAQPLRLARTRFIGSHRRSAARRAGA
jgi:hypothetical protein